jgi:hypothetical protein
MEKIQEAELHWTKHDCAGLQVSISFQSGWGGAERAQPFASTRQQSFLFASTNMAATSFILILASRVPWHTDLPAKGQTISFNAWKTHYLFHPRTWINLFSPAPQAT